MTVEIEGLELPLVWVLESAKAPLWLGRGAAGGLSWWPWGPELLRFDTEEAAQLGLERLRGEGELPGALEVLVVARVEPPAARDTDPAPAPTSRPPGLELEPWPDEATTAVEVPHPPTPRLPGLAQAQHRCRCGAPLVRAVGSPPGDPWTCAALLLEATEPGSHHDERTAEALAPCDGD